MPTFFTPDERARHRAPALIWRRITAKGQPTTYARKSSCAATTQLEGSEEGRGLAASSAVQCPYRQDRRRIASSRHPRSKR
jgi:hypothetical protein